MGYTTDFEGKIKVEPSLSREEMDYLLKFNKSRRMNHENGPYYVGNGGFMGQERNSGVINYNQPPAGQPGLWCQWKPSECGSYIEWDGGEKFTYSDEWMKYLIDHFIGLNPKAITELTFLKPHQLNGEIQAQGEYIDDKWVLIVDGNEVSREEFVFSSKKVCCPHCDEEFHLEQAE